MCDVAPDLIRDDGGTRVRLRVTSRDLGTAEGEVGRGLLSALMLDSGDGAHSDIHSDGR